METAPENPAPPADPPADAPEQRKPAFEEVILQEPIVRGSTKIERIQLRKPKAGELRGLQIDPLMQGDINSILALVPRISIPPLLPQEVEQMEMADLAAVIGAVKGFFMSKAEQEMIAKFLGMTETETSTG